MRFKKILAIFLAAALILSTLTFGVSAESTEIFEVEVEAMTTTSTISSSPIIYIPGEVITVKIGASQNTGVSQMKLQINYDANVLEVVEDGYEATGLFTENDTLTSKMTSDGQGYLIFYSDNYPYVSMETGTFAEIKFVVKQTCAADTAVTVSTFMNSAGNCVVNTIFGARRVPFVSTSDTFSIHNVSSQVSVVTDPTCTEEGYTTYTCGLCEESVVGNIVPANGHTDDDAVAENTVPPTCEGTGSYDAVVYCSVCGEELSRNTITIPATGHTEADAVEENRVEAECEKDGSYDMVVYCTICEKELSRVAHAIEALGHTEGEAVEENRVESTCEGEGSYDVVVYCTVCNKELSRETKTIEPKGHTEGEAVEENRVEPNCEETGSYDVVVYCTVCNKELSRETKTIDALGHKNGEAVVENRVEPDCVTSGSYDEVVYCTVCNKEVSRVTKTIDALGHTAGEAVEENRVEPTCETEGSYDVVVYCTVCNAEVSRETKAIAALGHTAGEAVEENRVEPTCTAEGSYDVVVYCTVCNKELSRETKSIEALGHDLDHTEKKEPTCTEIGWNEYDTCKREGCGYTTYEEIAAKGHTYGETTVIEPEYKTEGYSVHTCVVCQYEEKFDITAALTYILGDVNGNEVIDSDDAIHLLYNTFSPEQYVINQTADFNGDGKVDSDDAIYLLYFTFQPEQYPLSK